MSRVIVLQHVAHESPGRIVPVFRDFGIPVEVRHLYRGDEGATDIEELRALIVMGGPMGVGDVGKPEFPFLAGELELLKRMVAADRTVLGICLGAQLLASAGGAKVYPNTKPAAAADQPPAPLPEIGWGPIRLPFPGGTEPILMGVHDGAQMFHWHFDTFDLPKLPPPPPPPAGTPPGPPPPTGNALLASTRACKNQAFRFKTRLFGFQFHFEMDRDGIEAMLQNAKDDWMRVLGAGGDAKIRADTERFYGEYERIGNRIIGNFVEFLRLYA